MILELTFVFVALLGLIVIWANHRRPANQVFAVVCVLLLGWLWAIYRGFDAPHAQFLGLSGIWHRLNSAISAFFPWMIWMLREVLVAPRASLGRLFLGSWPFFLGGIAVGGLTAVDAFRFVDPDTGKTVRGWPYLAVIVFGVTGCAAILATTWRRSAEFRDSRRMELRYLVINLACAFIVAFVLVGLGNLFDVPALRRTIFPILIATLGVAGWAIAFHRVFEVRQLWEPVLEGLGVLLVCGLCVAFVFFVADHQLIQVPDIVVGAMLGAAAIVVGGRNLRRWLRHSRHQRLLGLRRELIELARSVPQTAQLIGRFEALLCRHCGADRVRLLMSRGAELEVAADRLSWSKPPLTALVRLGWATPEGLERRRDATDQDALAAWMVQQEFAAVVAVPRGSPAPALVLALGPKASAWPYTYPEIEQLQDLGELMDNVLARAEVTAQAALRARAEQLAMMSRGLAHDLKNLLTPVSSFLMHLDPHYPPGSAEAEAHGAARRSVNVMTDYVREALFFSSRLEPRFEPVNVGRMIATALALAAPRAQARGVTLASGPTEEILIEADGVLLQRLLANLLGNAIDASRPDSEVAVIASPPEHGRVRLEVVDWGCGIEPGSLEKIFEAYYTTKVFGEDVRGFGLGLTISRKIVDLHGGKIHATSTLGRGTTITVDLPVVQPRAVRTERAA